MPDLVPRDEAHHHERLRIARDLHDTLAQSLAGLGFAMDAIIAGEELSDAARRQLRSIRLDLSHLLNELREEILALRTIEESSIESWLQSRLPIDFTWRRYEANAHVNQAGLELAHLLLELLNNAISHQGLLSAIVEEYATDLNIQFLDFTTVAKRERTSGARIGRVGISERLTFLGAELTESATGVTLRWR